MEINVDVNGTIMRPVAEVFNAIVQPEKMTNYFISHASAPLVQGTDIVWEFKDYGVKIDVQVKAIEENKLISFEWEASGRSAPVEIHLESIDDQLTKINIKETGFEMDEDGVKKVMQQTQGWTDFICSLKAWLYTGINLRNGQQT